MQCRDIGAVIFDMDGTLVDSEPLSLRAMRIALEHRGGSIEELEAASFHGLTWDTIGDRLLEHVPDGCEPITSRELQATFHRLHLEEPPPLIPGSREALVSAQRRLPTAICTSSQRESLQNLVKRVDLPEILPQSVCAEDCTRSKPDPQGYLLTASKLRVSPQRCLVFEDSVSGVTAARAAGMYVIAITACSPVASEVARAAHTYLNNFEELPADLFDKLSAWIGNDGWLAPNMESRRRPTLRRPI
jgi:HAD superfamily hydrolase (TIGR01509 family)